MDLKDIIKLWLDNEAIAIDWMAYIMIITAVLVVFFLQCVNAPYGRYSSSNWGPLIPSRLAWFIQEVPAVLIPVGLMMYDNSKMGRSNVVLLSLFLIHYTQRSFVYPLLIRGGKPTPFIPFGLALIFCSYNGYMQGRYLTTIEQYSDDWIYTPRTLIGIILFFTGMCINIHSDHILRNLRKPGEKGYKIPTGGMFDYISGANFFGEILEWFGYMVACWSIPGVAFFIFTLFNIGPRAVSHHKWYLQKFENYPVERKALIPFLL